MEEMEDRTNPTESIQLRSDGAGAAKVSQVHFMWWMGWIVCVGAKGKWGIRGFP